MYRISAVEELSHHVSSGHRHQCESDIYKTHSNKRSVGGLMDASLRQPNPLGSRVFVARALQKMLTILDVVPVVIAAWVDGSLCSIVMLLRILKEERHRHKLKLTNHEKNMNITINTRKFIYDRLFFYCVAIWTWLGIQFKSYVIWTILYILEYN